MVDIKKTSRSCDPGGFLTWARFALRSETSAGHDHGCEHDAWCQHSARILARTPLTAVKRADSSPSDAADQVALHALACQCHERMQLMTAQRLLHLAQQRV